MLGKVTKRTVDALKPGDRDVFLWDSELRGFGVKCTPKGRRVYVVQYQRGGRGNPTRRVTIGPHGPLTPDKARTEADRLLAEAKLGNDPAAARTRRRRESTISELADRYVTEHVNTHNRPSTAKEVVRLVEKLIKLKLGRTRVSALTRVRPSFGLISFSTSRITSLAVLGRLCVLTCSVT